jgi:hypothetical protein
MDIQMLPISNAFQDALEVVKRIAVVDGDTLPTLYKLTTPKAVAIVPHVPTLE